MTKIAIACVYQRVSEYCCDLRKHVRRTVKIVRVDEAYDFLLAKADALIHCIVKSFVLLGYDAAPRYWMHLNNTQGVISRSTIDNDVLDVRPSLSIN